MTAPAAPTGSWRERVLGVLLAQLRQGTSPEALALACALGAVLAVFPILGSTTLLCAIAAAALRLNQPAIQLVNWLCYPLQLLLLIPYYRLGERLGAPHLALSVPQLLERFRTEGPWRFMGEFGTIALGGVGAWCLTAPPAAAALYFLLRPALRRLALRLPQN
jgi:uncharacterized protein (DUF2062 family)